jgi:ankyrin repeat protein
MVQCDNGQVEVLKVLLEAGAEFNHVDNEGRNALYVAAQNGHVEVIKALLEGVGFNHTANNGFTPLASSRATNHEAAALALAAALAAAGATE